MCIPVVCPLWPGPSRPLSTERELSSQLTPAAAGSLTASESRHRGTGSPGNPGTATPHQPALDNCYQTGIITSEYAVCPALTSPSTPRDGRNPNTSKQKTKQQSPGLMRVFCRCFLAQRARLAPAPCVSLFARVCDITLLASLGHHLGHRKTIIGA